ncbi:MAG: hypothetical protein K2K41_02760 [Ruminiclostridium sp.]|nr:hypothetical protein [Ruminiclostridium sp.]MDE6725451.1 hypothetical protein [Ruminiclostridium sp.]
MNSEYREDSIIQNLKDSGCSSEIIETFVTDLRTKKYSEGMKLLAAHRRRLLEELHREQKQIDCLDYLVYRIKKENLI